MKRWLLCLVLGFSAAGCPAVLKPVQLTPEQQAILVEDTNPYRNEWLHDNCEVVDVTRTLTPNRARLRASEAGGNYVEVIYSASPLDLYSVMFNCPQIPPY